MLTAFIMCFGFLARVQGGCPISHTKSIYHSTTGDEESSPADLGAHITSISWFPPAGKTVVDMFAASCTDGTLRFFKKNGMLEKKIQAHDGAAICVEWNLDGSSLVTSGEDGEVKVWSRNGNLRYASAATC